MSTASAKQQAGLASDALCQEMMTHTGRTTKNRVVGSRATPTERTATTKTLGTDTKTVVSAQMNLIRAFGAASSVFRIFFFGGGGGRIVIRRMCKVNEGRDWNVNVVLKGYLHESKTRGDLLHRTLPSSPKRARNIVLQRSAKKKPNPHH